MSEDQPPKSLKDLLEAMGLQAPHTTGAIQHGVLGRVMGMGTDITIASISYGNDGTIPGLMFEVDGERYTFVFDDPSGIIKLQTALATLSLQANMRLKLLRDAINSDPAFGCEKTHPLMESVNNQAVEDLTAVLGSLKLEGGSTTS